MQSQNIAFVNIQTVEGYYSNLFYLHISYLHAPIGEEFNQCTLIYCLLPYLVLELLMPNYSAFDVIFWLRTWQNELGFHLRIQSTSFIYFGLHKLRYHIHVFTSVYSIHFYGMSPIMTKLYFCCFHKCFSLSQIVLLILYLIYLHCNWSNFSFA